MAPSGLVYGLTLSYRGTAYAGWQRQANALAVQQVVEEALASLLGHQVKIVGASRTDAGVHARGQVAHLALPAALPESALVHGTNHFLPDDIRVLAARRMPAGFHARRSALAKEYRYRMVHTPVLSPVDAPFAIRVDPRTDVEAMRRATRHLVGRHDFAAFARAGGSHRTTVRTVLLAGWETAGEELTFRIVGDAFLRGMVRALVGTLLEVGGGGRDPDAIPGLLADASRAAAGPTAPARGLVLEQVFYNSEEAAMEGSR